MIVVIQQRPGECDFEFSNRANLFIEDARKKQTKADGLPIDVIQQGAAPCAALTLVFNIVKKQTIPGERARGIGQAATPAQVVGIGLSTQEWADAVPLND